MALVFSELPWHEGEKAMHELMHVPMQHNPSVPYLSNPAAAMLQRFPLLAMGALDSDGQPWTTIWGGQPGFACGLPDSHIAIKVPVDAKYDPVVAALLGNEVDAGLSDEGTRGKPFAALSIMLEERRRVKLAGTAIAGALTSVDADDDEPHHVQAQLLAHIDESLGNCPKYLNQKRVQRHMSTPNLASEGGTLSPEAEDIVHKSDLFFVSSSHNGKDMDTNHRGGPPGFVRVMHGSDGGSSKLVWPEYSGNRLYQTLGNLLETPRAGLVFPDFETGDVLYVTGTTEVVTGSKASSVIAKTNLAVVLTIQHARHVQTGLHFRAQAGEPSPYNPTIRFLPGENKERDLAEEPTRTARLVKAQTITPTISQYTFKVIDENSDMKQSLSKAGQWVALDFSKHLDMGYSHMRDSDPMSLNDDFVRTFTVSSSPSEHEHSRTFDITIRKVGRATEYLSYQNSDNFDIRVKGFGGSFEIKNDPNGKDVGFIAGGVGITPLLAALPSLDVHKLRLLWSLRAVDVDLVTHVLGRYPKLAVRTTLFISPGVQHDQLAKLDDSGVRIERRRIEERDIATFEEVVTWHLCAPPGFNAALLKWLQGKNVVYEDFSY